MAVKESIMINLKKQVASLEWVLEKLEDRIADAIWAGDAERQSELEQERDDVEYCIEELRRYA